MAAIVLGWNPDRGDDWTPDYPTAITTIEETGVFQGRWRAGRHRAVPGTDAWLLLQAGRGQGPKGQGLIGHGIVASTPYRDAPDADAGGTSLYLRIDFDALLPRGDQIPAPVLTARVPGVDWNTVHRSGSRIPAAAEIALRSLWAEYAAPAEADPTAPAPGVFPAEALRRTAVNRYEWNSQARRECIAHHGTGCAACGFSFEAAYGDIGADFIHVHHLVPASRLGPGYELDPLTDLVPLCPNCHAMAHRRTPGPYTPAELRQMMAGAGHLKGTVVSNREIAAQEDAARILGTGPDALNP